MDAGQHDDQFPIDVFRPLCTSRNNSNEVIATCRECVIQRQRNWHRRKTCPPAVHPPLGRVPRELLRRRGVADAGRGRQTSSRAGKAGRTHLMDAVRSRSARSSAATPRRSAGPGPESRAFARLRRSHWRTAPNRAQHPHGLCREGPSAAWAGRATRERSGRRATATGGELNGALKGVAVSLPKIATTSS